MKKTNGFLLGLVVSLTFSAAAIAQNMQQSKITIERPKVMVFPNPVENMATFTVDPLGYPFLRCDVFNLLGNRVWSIPGKDFKAVQMSDSLSYQFNFSELPQGIYFVKFFYDNDGMQDEVTLRAIYSNK